MRTRLPRLALIAALGGASVLGGCLVLPGQRVVARRRVAEKVADSLLVADDYSRCLVNTRTFAAARVGQRRWCAWRRSDLAPTPEELPRGRPGRAPPRTVPGTAAPLAPAG